MNKYTKTFAQAMQEVRETKESNYKFDGKVVSISKANFSKVGKDYKNATPGQERMVVLDPKTHGTISAPVKFTEDYEVSMAIGQLKTIQERVGKIMDFLSGKSDDYNMEAWLQSKITSAEDKLNSVANYVTNNPEINETKEEIKEQDGSKIGPAGKIALAKEKDQDALEAQIVDLKGRLALAQQKIENEKNKAVKPVPNPETGEVPLQTGLAHAILKIKNDAERDQRKTKQVSKQIKKLSKESLDVVTESDASDKAKGMGLTYMKFGRYGKDGKVTHKSIGGSLTAVDKDEKPVKEPKSAKPKDEPKKDAAPADADEIKLKSKNFLRDLEKGNLENDDGMIEIDFDSEEGANAASELAAKQGLTDLASDLDDVAFQISDMEPEKAQAKMQDIEAKYSGGEVESVAQSQKADKAIDLFNDQDYDQETYSNFITDLTSTFDIVRKMVDSDDTEGNAGSGMRNSAKGFRPEVLDTIKSLDDIQSKVAEMRDDIEDEKIKDKLQEIADEIEFCVDDNADHDNYTKSHKVNGSIESIQDILKDLKSVKEETISYRIKSFKGFKPLTEDELTAKDLTKKPSLDDVLKKGTKKKEIKVGGKTKIEINPDKDIGNFSGGMKTNNGNLH